MLLALYNCCNMNLFTIFHTYKQSHGSQLARVQSHPHITITHSAVAEILFSNLLNALGGIQTHDTTVKARSHLRD